jgi:hypothetical protein
MAVPQGRLGILAQTLLFYSRDVAVQIDSRVYTSSFSKRLKFGTHRRENSQKELSLR